MPLYCKGNTLPSQQSFLSWPTDLFILCSARCQNYLTLVFVCVFGTLLFLVVVVLKLGIAVSLSSLDVVATASCSAFHSLGKSGGEILVSCCTHLLSKLFSPSLLRYRLDCEKIKVVAHRSLGARNWSSYCSAIILVPCSYHSLPQPNAPWIWCISKAGC